MTKINKKFISIIVPNLNNYLGLKKTLASLFKQNDQDFEIIVIDGGSTDKSIDLLKKYEKKIDIWISKKDNNLWDAMNKGIRVAKGNIVGILNSGDIYRKNATKIVKKYFINQPKIDFLFGSVKKKRIYSGFYPEKLILRFNIYPAHSSGFFIKRRVHKEIGLYDDSLEICADYDLFYKLIKNKYIGIATKKQEVTGEFNMKGLSSRVSRFKKLYYELKIRLKNKQNIFIVAFIFITRIIYGRIKDN